MRLLFAALLVIGATVGLTLVAQRDPGYVLVNYAGWSVESSLSLFLLALTIAFALFYLTLRLLAGMLHLPRRLNFWRRHRRAVRARRATNRGLIALAEGNWAKAERALSRHAADSDTPLINYLGAARAAQKRGEAQRRDNYLAQAYQSMPDAELAVGLTQAEEQLSQGQAEQALATLRHLRTIAPKHGYVLYLLKKIYERLESWDDLLELLPELRKQHVLTAEAADKLLRQIERQRLLGAADHLERLQQRWEGLPKELRHSSELLQVYAEQLIALGAPDVAEARLREFLKREWDPALIRLYGLCSGNDMALQLTTAERWLKEYEHHPELLLALGRIALGNQLWGKGRSYLEASIAFEPRAESYCELGNLLEQLGEKEKAANCFRQGLDLQVGDHCLRITLPEQSDSFHQNHPET